MSRFLCDWKEAVAQMRSLRSCKISPATFSFHEGSALKMLLEDCSNNNQNSTDCDNELNTQQEVDRLIEQVRSMKKTFGGARAFHEQFILMKSDQWRENTDGLFLASFEAAYIFNYFRLFVKNTEVALNILNVIESREKDLKLNDELFNEKKTIATFLKAVVHRQMLGYEECAKLFEQVIEADVNDHFCYLKSNAHYELGLLHYEVYEDMEEAKRHLKKAKSAPNQVSKQMIDHKVTIVMDMIRNRKNS